MFVAGHLGEVLYDWFVDDRAPLLGPHQGEALAEDMIASNVATELKDSATFERLVDQGRNSLGAFLVID